jgi:hypothetical protein
MAERRRCLSPKGGSSHVKIKVPMKAKVDCAHPSHAPLANEVRRRRPNVAKIVLLVRRAIKGLLTAVSVRRASTLSSTQLRNVPPAKTWEEAVIAMKKVPLSARPAALVR